MGLPVAVIGRVTDDGLITIVTGGLGRRGRPRQAPASWPGSRPGARQRGHRARRESGPRPPAPGGAAPGARQTVDRLPERGRTGRRAAGAARPPDLVAGEVDAQYDCDRGSPDTVAGTSTARRSSGSRGPPRPSSPRPTERRSAPSIRGGGSARRRGVHPQRRVTGAGPWASPTASTTATRTAGGVLAAQEGVRGLGDACRALGLPITGGNVSLYNESAATAPSHPRPRWAWSGCWTTSAEAGRAACRARGRGHALWAPAPGLAGSIYAGSPARGPTTARRGRPRRRGAAQASPRGRAGGLVAVRPGRQRWRPRGRARRDVLWAGVGADLTLAVGRRSRRSSCSAKARRVGGRGRPGTPAFELCPPARRAGASPGSTGGDAAAHPARRRGRRRARRRNAERGRGRARRAARRAPRCLGARPAARPRR